ncbi:MAG: type I-B CRISPR-associated protein Cas7/Cst2/DevR [Candidatus Aenigmatarchaeota archaeon]
MNKTNNENKQNGGRRYIVMDIVFYGSSLNYDQGIGNYQELKKITKWDGKQYILVSRYALRYSILHWANKLFPNEWKLAGRGELEVENEVVHPKKELIQNNNILSFPEFDLFGFMIAKEGEPTITRVSPVKISHAISLTPYNYDVHFTANLDMMKRAAGPGAGSNPVNMEEKMDFYVYNIVIDVDRIGKYTKEEHGIDIGDIDVTNKRIDRIIQLVETIFNLKREIKGRMEDLSPWLVICGLYENGKYETYMNKIELAKSHVYKVITKEKETIDSEGRKIKEIEHEIIEKDAPKFVIDINKELVEKVTKEEIIEKIKKFLKNLNENATSSTNSKPSENESRNKEDKYPMILIYKRQFIETEPPLQESNTQNKK